ncbi:MAG: heme-binding protein [Caulobacteraceae bacterium]
MKFSQIVTTLLASLVATAASAQAPAPPAGGPPAPPPPRAKGPALTPAVQAAQAAVVACAANGYKVTALITDSAGDPVVLLSGDGAAVRTQGIAKTKVAAALKYKMSSGEVVAKAKADPKLDAEIKADPAIGTARQGAVLIMAGTDILGAFAVSGAPGGDKDEACVKAAMDKIKLG